MKRVTAKKLRNDTKCRCDNCCKKAKVSVIVTEHTNFCESCGQYYIKSVKQGL